MEKVPMALVDVDRLVPFWSKSSKFAGATMGLVNETWPVHRQLFTVGVTEICPESAPMQNVNSRSIDALFRAT